MKTKADLNDDELKVLHLEDSIQDMELTREQLLSEGYNLDLTHVKNEADYIAALRKQSFDLILADFKLPGFDAFGALEISKKLSPETPLICVSGSIGEETAVELLKQGAVDYVLKDRPERLPMAIQRALEEAKLKAEYKKATEELRQSEEKFKTISMNSPDHILIQDMQLKYTFVFNPQLGLTVDDMLGKTDYELGTSKADADKLTRIKKSVLEGKSTEQMLIPIKNLKGETEYFEGIYSPKYDNDGKINGLIGYFRNVTKQVQAETKLKKFNQNWKFLTKATQQLNSVLELPTVMRNLVASARELTGAKDGTAGLLIGVKMVFKEYDQNGNIFPIDYSFEKDYGVPGWVMATRKPYITNNAENDKHVIPEIQKALGFYNLVDVPILNKHGEIIGCFELHNKPDNFDEHDVMLLQALAAGAAIAIENSQMIMQRKQAEEALRQSEEKFKNLFENNIAPMLLIDPDNGNLVDVNEAAVKYYGWSRDEMRRMNINQINTLPPEAIEKEMKKARESRRTYFEFKHKRADGTIRDVEVFVSKIEIEGKDYLHSIVHDITPKKEAEEALKKSEEKYREFFEKDLTGDFLSTVDGKLIDCNPALLKILGYDSLEEIKKHSLSSIYKNETDRDNFIKVIKEKGEVSYYESTLIRKDGKEIYVIENTYGVFNEKGKLTHLRGYIFDITDRKIAEEKYRLISQSATDAIVTADSDGNVVEWNPASEKMFGYSAEEMLNKSLNIIIPPGYREQHSKGMQRIAGGGEHRVIGKTVELEGLHKKGKIFPVELSLAEWTTSGRKYYTGIIRDISERKRDEEEIKKLSTGVEQSSSSIVITDVEGNIEYVNKKFTEITGYTSEEAIGKNPRILKSGKHDPQIYNELWTTIKSGKEWHGELLNKKKSGELFWESESISPIVNTHGKITNFIAVKDDITEHKKLVEELREEKKRAEAADKMKSEFLAQMSHEIRSPLNAVINFTNIIKEETADIKSEELKLSFDAIDSASKRIIRTIDLILNMTDLQLGTYKVTKRSVELSGLLKNLINEYESTAKAKNLNLLFKCELEETMIETDDYAANQIFANLIDNAIKYTDQGLVEIRLLQENDKYKVEIEDSGIGISEEYLPELFSPFSQEEHGYSRKFEGAGLGMALVKKYCEIIKADISVKSKKNIGTTFTVTLPKKI